MLELPIPTSEDLLHCTNWPKHKKVFFVSDSPVFKMIMTKINCCRKRARRPNSMGSFRGVSGVSGNPPGGLQGFFPASIFTANDCGHMFT